MTRAIRTRRPSPFVLTERDGDILGFVATCRYVSALQVGREFFPSIDRCRRRLRALFDHGLVRVTLASSTAPNIVSLTPRGRDALRKYDPDAADRAPLPSTINLAGVRHHCLVVDARCYVAALAEAHGPRFFEWCGSGSARLKDLGLSRFHLQPDGLAEFATPGGVFRVACEIDRGTEGLRTLAAKFAKYRESGLGHEPVHELWCVGEAGLERARNLAETALEAGIAEATRLMTVAHIVARPVLPPGPTVAAERKAEHGLNSPAVSVLNPATASRVTESRRADDGRAVGTADGWGG